MWWWRRRWCDEGVDDDDADDVYNGDPWRDYQIIARFGSRCEFGIIAYVYLCLWFVYVWRAIDVRVRWEKLIHFFFLSFLSFVNKFLL